jgi:hypothetical protein
MSSLTDFPPCCLRNLLASAAYGVFTRGYYVSRVHIRKECGSESPAVASSFYTFLLYKCTGMPQRPNAMRFKAYERGHPAFGGKTTRTQFSVVSALQEALV